MTLCGNQNGAGGVGYHCTHQAGHKGNCSWIIPDSNVLNVKGKFITSNCPYRSSKGIECTLEIAHKGFHSWDALRSPVSDCGELYYEEGKYFARCCIYKKDHSGPHSWNEFKAQQHPANEVVDHPAHYGGGDNPYEAIKVLEAWKLNFHLGNVVKYIARSGKKGSELEDLRKAKWYLDRYISSLAR